MGRTSIEWATDVWNPVTGCTKVSEGCRNCYAERLHRMRHEAYLRGAKVPGCYATPFETVVCHDERMGIPVRWKKSKRFFVDSMSDLFHEQVPMDFIANVFAVMYLADWHMFMVLTKRAGRMQAMLNSQAFWDEYRECVRVLSDDTMTGGERKIWNVWLGVSVENQKAADERIPLLLKTPASTRFVSCEPLLGPVDLGMGLCPTCGGSGETAGHYYQDDGMETCDDCGGIGLAFDSIDWVICGGESGPGARPMDPDWARSLLDQCLAMGVPFFFKQWGEWAPDDQIDPGNRRDPMIETDMSWVREGKRKAGRLLDGREWNEFPG